MLCRLARLSEVEDSLRYYKAKLAAVEPSQEVKE